MFKVDKGIPIPKKTNDRGRQLYPWSKLEIGDSFFVPQDFKEPHKVKKSVAQRNLTDKPKRYKAYNESDGVRVWRIE